MQRIAKPNPGRRALRLAVLLGVCSFVAPIGATEAATVQLKGTIKIVSTIVTDSTTPIGTPISVYIAASAYASGVDSSETFSTSVTLKKTANTQTATFTFPYAWALSDPTGTVHVITEFTPYLAANPSSRISVIFGATLALPANGATTTVNVPVRF
jgi:hypothetical protein